MATGRIPINGTAAIQETIVNAKGDLIVGTGADAVSRLAVGANTYTLVADSAEATGLKWAAPASGSTFVGCKLRKTATTFTLANNTNTAFTFDAEEYDTDGFHDNVTNNSRITIPTGKGGKYLFIAKTLAESLSTGALTIRFAVNGSEKTYDMFWANGDNSGTSSEYLNLSAGDYVTMQVFQASGSAKTCSGTNGGVIYTSFSCTYLGA